MITAQVENLTANLETLKPIFPLHWEELALNKDKVPLDPDYSIYLDMDAKGQILYVALRDEGQLAGYFVGFIKPGLHYRTCLTCMMDIFYVVPKHRGQRGGLILFKAVENECKRRGVQRMVMGSKLHKDAGALFERLGYGAIETFYSKWIGE